MTQADASFSSDSPEVTLKRTLRLRDLVVYGIILVQPTGPMPVFGVIYDQARGHVVTAILIALIAMLLTAVSYGYMAHAYPAGGSAFTYVGRQLHPSLGYLTGWCMAMDYILNPLICTIWAAKATANFIPATGLLPAAPLVPWIVFFAVLFTACNLLGVESSARLNAMMTAALCIVIVIVVAAFLRYLHALHSGSAAFYLSPFYDPSRFSRPALLRGTSIAVLTYIGFDGISTLADEARKPATDMPRAIVTTCLLTGVLATVLTYLAQLVWPLGKIFPDLDTAYVFVAARAGGPVMFALVNGALLLATIGSGMAAHLGAARLLYAMGQDGALPRRFFGAVHPASRVPRNNVLLIGTIVLLGALTLSYEKGAELLNYGALIAFMGVNLASASLALKAEQRGWFAAVTGMLGFAVCLFLWASLGRLALTAGTIWAAFGVMLYLARRGASRLSEQHL